MKEDASSATPSAQHDWFIQSLVNVANVAPLSFGVTLQVSGLLVSGYLVSGKAYFAAVGQQVVSGFSQNAALADEMRKLFATFESGFLDRALVVLLRREEARGLPP